MYKNWFSPSQEFQDIPRGHSDSSFGHSLQTFDHFQINPKGSKIALVGYEAKMANRVRSSLFRLESPWKSLPIVDLGNLRKQDPNFAIQAGKALVADGIIPLFIGGSEDLSRVLLESFQEYRSHINLVLVDQDLNAFRIDKGYWQNVLQGAGHLKDISLMAYQSHFLSQSETSLLEDRFLDILRLGQIRKNPEASEPVARNADIISINLNVIRYSDCPEQKIPSSNGLFGEELCRISRYAGISDKLRAFAIHGIGEMSEGFSPGADIMAQCIWYFVDGVMARRSDFPVSTGHLREYLVDHQSFDDQISFWKSDLTGRWWVQLWGDEEDPKKAKMIPCTLEDYQLASNDELSERLLRFLQRLA
ncbi:MAG: hypothetical protein HKN16_13365 [Saprospiraceae bacterium]|nr:hypothetical protein [Saprospiraceae bacterium]